MKMLFLFIFSINSISIIHVAPNDQKCGIANYAKNILNVLQNYEELNIQKITGPEFLKLDFSQLRPDIIELSFYHLTSNNHFLEKIKIAKEFNIKIILNVHEIYKIYKPFFELADKIIIHRNYLNAISEFKNKAIIIELGCPLSNLKELEISSIKKKYGFNQEDIIISTFGFFMKWRMNDLVLEKLIPLINKNKNIKIQFINAIHPHHNVNDIIEKMKQLILNNKIENQIILINDFIPENEINERLFISDIGFIWGDPIRGSENSTFHASSSASLNEFISAKLPIIINNINHLGQINHGAKKINNDIELLPYYIEYYLKNPTELFLLKQGIISEYNDNNYFKIAEKYKMLYLTI
jgi:hypothetical protein